MKRGMIITLTAIILILVIIGVFVYFFYAKSCNSQECFNDSLSKCRPAYFTSDNEDTLMQYRIEGRTGDKCKIRVELLQIKKGASELASLEGTSMECYTEFGVVVSPEQNLGECHGLLKEGIQEIMIKRLHTQIVQNLGKISEETTKII